MTSVTLEKEAKIVVIIEVILQVLLSCLYIALLIFVLLHRFHLLRLFYLEYDYVKPWAAILVALTSIAHLINLFIVVILFKGFRNRQVGKYIFWYITQLVACAVFFVPAIVIYIFYINWMIIFPAYFLAYRIWSIYVIHSFSNALKKSRKENEPATNTILLNHSKYFTI